MQRFTSVMKKIEDIENEIDKCRIGHDDDRIVYLLNQMDDIFNSFKDEPLHTDERK